MSTALIGHSGFVGSNLLAQGKYDSLFRSSDIHTIRGTSFDHIVCAGVQAMKWWANLHPEEDLAGIEKLLAPLAEVKAERFTLISTIDVYPSPSGVDEESPIDLEGHHAYGLHRLLVERRITEMFPKVVILRLPGLFGPGLKKNVIFDMQNDNNLDKIHPGGVFQYYDLRRLTDDIDRTWNHDISLLNVSSEPISTLEIQQRFFSNKTLGGSGPAPAGYDMRSKHAGSWNGSSGYLYSKETVLNDLANLLSSQ